MNNDDGKFRDSGKTFKVLCTRILSAILFAGISHRCCAFNRYHEQHSTFVPLVVEAVWKVIERPQL